MSTPMLLKPSLEEVKLAAAKIALPDREAEKFWNYYESQGWHVGRCKMVSFKNALAGWKLRFEERNYGNNRRNATENPRNAFINKGTTDYGVALRRKSEKDMARSVAQASGATPEAGGIGGGSV